MERKHDCKVISVSRVFVTEVLVDREHKKVTCNKTLRVLKGPEKIFHDLEDATRYFLRGVQ